MDGAQVKISMKKLSGPKNKALKSFQFKSGFEVYKSSKKWK